MFMYCYFYVYLFLMLCLCILITFMYCIFIFMYYYVYVFFLLCILRSLYSDSLCCTVYCLCVNVYCTAATVCQLNCSYQIYQSQQISEYPIPDTCLKNVTAAAISKIWYQYFQDDGWTQAARYRKQHHIVKVKESRNRPGVAQRVPGGLGSQISWNSARKVVRLSASRTGRLYPQECSWYQFSLRAESTPGPWYGRMEICHWKIQWQHRESIPGPSA